MSNVPPTLSEALEDIPDAIITALQQATTLSDVKAVVRGDRSRGRKDLPVLWVLPEYATPTTSRLSMAEEWEMSVSLVAIVKNEDPEKGNMAAIDLAARARGVFITKGSRNLSLGYVRDIKSGKFEFSSPYDGEGNIYASLAELKITFITQG